MNPNVTGPGYPFEHDYPEVYDDPLSYLQVLLSDQLNELERNDPVQDAAVIGFLRGRRCGQRNVVQIETMNRCSARVLLASREIIVSSRHWSDHAVREALCGAGFNDRGASDGPYVRLVNNRSNRQASQYEPAERIVTRASRNTLAVTASVGKGVGGPEPVLSPLGAGSSFQQYASQHGAQGQGPVVAVIDTGIPGKQEDGLPTMNRTDGWLDDVARDDTNRDLLDHLPHRDGYLDYQAGHGTFVAGIVQRVAPAARLRVYRAADTDGFADDVGTAHALRQAVLDGAKIINLSLGMTTVDNVPPPALAKTLKWIAKTYTGDEAVVVIAAAGNFGDATPCWPAAFAEVEAVGALIETEDVENYDTTARTGTFEPAPWSSKGDHIGLWTVAEGVRSTFVTGYESPAFDDTPADFPPDAWALWSGTSFAAPQVAGAVARIAYEKNVTPGEALELLRGHGAPVDGQAGKGVRILSGIPRI